MEQHKIDIIKDFDRISKIEERKWEHNNHYHKYLIKNMPDNREKALEIGCGKGVFARLMAKDFKKVIAVDFSEGMIEKAKAISKDLINIEYKLEDITKHDFKNNKYDCIVSIATMHHLPFREMLIKAKEGLKDNGVFMVLDLYESKTITDYLVSLFAAPVNIIFMLFKNGSLRPSEEERKAWKEHSKNDVYMSFKDIKTICKKVMPEAKVRRHFFWRYSIVWRKEL